jgi:hypothetical protein
MFPSLPFSVKILDCRPDKRYLVNPAQKMPGRNILVKQLLSIGRIRMYVPFLDERIIT